MKSLLHAALVALLAAGPPAAAQPPGPAPTLSAPWPKAKRLRPTVARLVRVLARQARIESSHVGPEGGPSRSWAAFDAVRAAATPAELASLLGHASPIVRGYVGRHLARTAPTLDLDAIDALLRDGTVVRLLDGCDKGASSLGHVIAATSIWNTTDKAGATALRARVDTDPQRYPEDVRALVARQRR